MTYYDSIAKGYDELHEEEQLKKLKVIAGHLKIRESESLLDVGCGSGISTRYFRCKRTGIDPSEKLLDIAIKNDPSGRYIKGSAESLPFKDKEFDVVISVTAIQNFDDIKKGICEIKRVGNNKYALSFLKAANNRVMIKALLEKEFPDAIWIREDKDLVMISSD